MVITRRGDNLVKVGDEIELRKDSLISRLAYIPVYGAMSRVDDDFFVVVSVLPRNRVARWGEVSPSLSLV